MALDTPNTEMPKYRQMNPKGFFADDDNLYPEGTEFYWLDTPNEFMEPLNQPAVDAMNKYLDFLDECAKKHAEKMGRPFYGRPRTQNEQIDQAREDAQAIADAKAAGVAPKRNKIRAVERAKPGIQGHMTADGKMLKRKPGRPSKMSGVKLPEPVKAPEQKPVAILGSNFADILPIRG